MLTQRWGRAPRAAGPASGAAAHARTRSRGAMLGVRKPRAAAVVQPCVPAVLLLSARHIGCGARHRLRRAVSALSFRGADSGAPSGWRSAAGTGGTWALKGAAERPGAWLGSKAAAVAAVGVRELRSCW